MNVGKRTRVPLRKVRALEATSFTRSLEDKVEILNEVIDLNVTGAEREKTAGSFSVDLVAEDEDGGTVVIQNQLKPSDHDHLGSRHEPQPRPKPLLCAWLRKFLRGRTEHSMQEAPNLLWYAILKSAATTCLGH